MLCISFALAFGCREKQTLQPAVAPRSGPALSPQDENELNEWNVLEGSEEGCNDYLKKFPDGKHLKDARQCLEDEQAWRSAQRVDSRAGYEKYIFDYPNGMHHLRARGWLAEDKDGLSHDPEQDNELAKENRTLWDSKRAEDSAIADILLRGPESRFVIAEIRPGKSEKQRFAAKGLNPTFLSLTTPGPMDSIAINVLGTVGTGRGSAIVATDHLLNLGDGSLVRLEGDVHWGPFVLASKSEHFSFVLTKKYGLVCVEGSGTVVTQNVVTPIVDCKEGYKQRPFDHDSSDTLH